MSDDRNVNLNTNLISFKNVDISGVPNRKNSRGDGYVPQEEEKEEEQGTKKSEFMDKSDLLRMSLETLASINVPIKRKLKNNAGPEYEPENDSENEIISQPEPKINIFKDNPIS